METPMTSQEYITPSSDEDEVVMTEISSPEINSNQATSNETTEEWRKIGLQISDFLEQLPTYINRFFEAYKLPLISIGSIVAGIVTIKLVLAIMSALNDIPLFSASFQLIGIGFIVWFISRYLIKASTRQELAVEIQKLKEQIIGENSSETSSETFN
jgi:hypothetical protein